MASVNEIGDFVAGAFAPIGVVWLIVTVLQQKAAVAAARAEFEEGQRATYFIALFDKRYELLLKIRTILGSEPNDASRSELFEATEMASLLFGKKVPALLGEYQNKFFRFKVLDIEIGKLQRAKVEDVDETAKKFSEQHEITLWLYDLDRRIALEKEMFSFLRAPDTPTVKSAS